MPNFYGSSVAQHVQQHRVKVGPAEWAPLVGADGATTPLKGRLWLRISPKGRDGVRVALRYSNRNADGTFTAPTLNAHGATIIPSVGSWIEPIGDRVMVYARCADITGAPSPTGIEVIVTEFA